MQNLSIIIPVHNESEQINHTIKKLSKLKSKINFEILFIDDFSTDQSYEILLKSKKK